MNRFVKISASLTLPRAARLILLSVLAIGASYASASTPDQRFGLKQIFDLQWAADPHMEERKSMGVQVVIFLLVLCGLLYLAYKAVWRGQSH